MYLSFFRLLLIVDGSRSLKSVYHTIINNMLLNALFFERITVTNETVFLNFLFKVLDI